MVNVIKKEIEIEESIKELLGDIFEYASVVNNFFLPQCSQINKEKPKSVVLHLSILLTLE